MANLTDPQSSLEAGNSSILPTTEHRQERRLTSSNLEPEAEKSVTERQTRLTTANFSLDKMSATRKILLTCLTLALLTLSYSSVVPPRNNVPNSLSQTENDGRFQEMLESVSDASLHKVMNEYSSSKYKPGVYREDRTALQAVHEDNAAVATSLVELARRQSLSNSTTSSVPSSTPIVSTSDTVTETSTTTQESSSAQDSSSTIVVAPTSTFSTETSSPPTTTASPGTTASSGQSSQTSSVPPSTTPPSSSSPPTTSSIISTSDNSPVSSSAPPSSRRSTTSQIVQTTTLPNGARSTITSYTIVPADQPATQVQGPSGTGTVAPSLQSGAAAAPLRASGSSGAMGSLIVGVVGLMVVL